MAGSGEDICEEGQFSFFFANEQMMKVPRCNVKLCTEKAVTIDEEVKCKEISEVDENKENEMK